MKRIIGYSGVLAVLLVVLSFAVATPPAPGPVATQSAVLDSGQLALAGEVAECSDVSVSTLDLAAGPHCCGAGAGAACRDLCKQQGPGCKGTIGCRAGECVCNCSCP